MFPGLPSRRFFRPDSYKKWQFERRILRTAHDAPHILHMAHGPCMDGATCDVLVRRKYGSDAVRSIFLAPHETTHVLTLLRAVPSRNRQLIISDLSLQKGQADEIAELIEGLAQSGWRISWRDHHHKQWEGVDFARLRDACDLTLDMELQESGATLVQKALLPDDAYAAELAEVARDHDLWLRQDPRSETLIRSYYGAPSFGQWVQHFLPGGDIITEDIRTWAAAEDAKTEKLVAWGLKKSKIVQGKRAKIGLVYGRVPTNDVLHRLEEDGAHLSILLKPTGTFSLRSIKDVAVCHHVAQSFNGGGHPNASGGKLDIHGLALARLWRQHFEHDAVRPLVARAVAEVDKHLAARTK